MKKTTWRWGLVLIVAGIAFLLYPNFKKGSTENCVSILQELINGDTYAVEVTDASGESHVVEEARKEQLAQLIVQTIQKTEQLPDMEGISTMSVRIFGGEPVTEVVLMVYDQKEETNFGILLWKERTYPVQNCGEILNYLAELGFYTER